MSDAYPTGNVDHAPKEALVAVTAREVSPWDRGRRIGRPFLIAAVVGTLVFVQVRAHLLQWRAGYRPLEREPGRVAFSWDMFAVRITRCAVTFSPPLLGHDGVREAPSFASLSPTLEWNPIFNETPHWARYAEHLCSHYSRPGEEVRVKLTCFTPEAERRFYDMRCQ